MNQETICLDSDSISLCSESVAVSVIEICSSDSSIELIETVPPVFEQPVIDICSSDSSIELIETVTDSSVIETDSGVTATDSGYQDLSVSSLESWLSGSSISSDSSYKPSDSSLSDLSLNSRCSSSKSEPTVSFATADAAELFDPEVPIAAFSAYQNLDILSSISDSFTIDSDLDSYTGDLNPDHSKTNVEIVQEQREELDLEWNLFEFEFNQKFPDPKSFTVLCKYYKEASKKRLEIANKWWKLIYKYTVPQPAPPIALEL